ncbi:MAG: 1,4-dihydroxy-2-naphthoate octaprenyltransferase [Capnocytophaga sp.]|nr:1,4-dihydroxy-2-naphthoate octaprenyltransferase [Capnocytophaga sp.]
MRGVQFIFKFPNFQIFILKLITILRAARLRTLPLSASGIIMGSALAYRAGYFDGSIFALALLTTIFFQILSNFANDYGDGVKGTDNEHRVGPQRAIQSGIISRAEMKRIIWVMSVLSVLSALSLIWLSFGWEQVGYVLLFVALAGASIAAAIKYTVGKSAYGYRGLGDLFVFIFFGLLSVLGSYFLYIHQLHWRLLLPAVAVGFLSVGVLNLNNMRDYENDKAVGKNTLVVKLGMTLAKYYHYYLIVGAMVAMLFYSAVTLQIHWQLLYLLAFVPLSLHLLRVRNYKNLKLLDKELKIVAISTFLMSILFFIGQIL